jgi:hypothetical protein
MEKIKIGKINLTPSPLSEFREGEFPSLQSVEPGDNGTGGLGVGIVLHIAQNRIYELLLRK